MSKNFNTLNGRDAPGVKGPRVSTKDYKFGGHRRTYPKARVFKIELKNQGFRVKIKPDFTKGGYNIFYKDIRRIDQENNDRHRRRSR